MPDEKYEDDFDGNIAKMMDLIAQKPKSSFSCQEVSCGSVSTWLPNFRFTKLAGSARGRNFLKLSSHCAMMAWAGTGTTVKKAKPSATWADYCAITRGLPVFPHKLCARNISKTPS